MPLPPAHAEFFRSDRTAGEFSAMTGISQDTLRDWRKRGISQHLGEQLVSGYWGYSMWDALSIEVARSLKGSGFEWKDALWMGYVAAGYLVEEARFGKYVRSPEVRYIVFRKTDPNAQSEHVAGEDLTAMVQRVFETDAPPVVNVVDLLTLFTMLPEEYRTALNGLED